MDFDGLKKSVGVAVASLADDCADVLSSLAPTRQPGKHGYKLMFTVPLPYQAFQPITKRPASK